MTGANYRDFSAYFESKNILIRTLKERRDLHSLITVGRAFHMSGPLCRIDLGARRILGLSGSHENDVLDMCERRCCDGIHFEIPKVAV